MCTSPFVRKIRSVGFPSGIILLPIGDRQPVRQIDFTDCSQVAVILIIGLAMHESLVKYVWGKDVGGGDA